MQEKQVCVCLFLCEYEVTGENFIGVFGFFVVFLLIFLHF